MSKRWYTQHIASCGGGCNQFGCQGHDITLTYYHTSDTVGVDITNPQNEDKKPSSYIFDDTVFETIVQIANTQPFGSVMAKIDALSNQRFLEGTMKGRMDHTIDPKSYDALKIEYEKQNALSEKMFDDLVEYFGGKQEEENVVGS